MFDLSRKLQVAPTLQRLAPGYGSCGRCKWPWPFVVTHCTDFAEGNGCFPLCEQCWQSLGTPEARMPFYETLITYWLSFGPLERGQAEAIRAAVLEGK